MRMECWIGYNATVCNPSVIEQYSNSNIQRGKRMPAGAIQKAGCQILSTIGQPAATILAQLFVHSKELTM
jgi:hypothetical protein